MKFQRDNRGRTDVQTRSAQVRADSANDDAMTIDATLATDRPVRMFDYQNWEVIDEILPASGRSESPHMPLLDSHSRHSVANNLGHLEDVRDDGGNTACRLVFDKDDDLASRTYRKYKNGHLRSVSVGYEVMSFTTLDKGETRSVGGTEYTASDKRRLRIAMQWRVDEGSAVNLPADDQANVRGVRSSEVTEEQAAALLKQRDKMDGGDVSAPVNPSPAEPGKSTERGREMGDKTPDTQVADDKSRQDELDKAKRGAAEEAITAERARVARLREIAGDDVRSETLQKAIDEGTSVEDFQGIALKDIRGQKSDTPPGSDAPNIQLSGNRHSRDCNVASLTAGLAMRMGVKDPAKTLARIQYNPTSGELRFHGTDFQLGAEDQKELERNLERGHKFRNLHSVDLCREGLRIAEEEAPLERRELVTRAYSTPGVSTIYTQSTAAVLLQNLGTMIDSTAGWTAEREANSFKEQELHKLEGGKLNRRARGKKATTSTFSDMVEKYRVTEFADTLLLDRQDIVDDEIGAWQTAMAEYARAILAVRPDLVYSLLLTNPTLQDSVALFAAGHNNIKTGALDQAGVQAGMSAVALQQNANGINLNLMANYLICAATKKFDARRVANSTETRQADSANGTLNPVQQDNLQIRSEARLDTGFNDPITGAAIAPAPDMFLNAVASGAYGVVVGTLAGTNGMPTMSSNVRNSGGIYGIELDVAHIMGAGVSDHRGLCRTLSS